MKARHWRTWPQSGSSFGRDNPLRAVVGLDSMYRARRRARHILPLRPHLVVPRQRSRARPRSVGLEVAQAIDGLDIETAIFQVGKIVLQAEVAANAGIEPGRGLPHSPRRICGGVDAGDKAAGRKQRRAIPSEWIGCRYPREVVGRVGGRGARVMLPGVLPTGPVFMSPAVVLSCGASTIKNARFLLQYSCKVEIVGASVSPGMHSRLKISTLSNRNTPPVGFDVNASSKFGSGLTRTAPSAPP